LKRGRRARDGLRQRMRHSLRTKAYVTSKGDGKGRSASIGRMQRETRRMSGCCFPWDGSKKKNRDSNLRCSSLAETERRKNSIKGIDDMYTGYCHPLPLLVHKCRKSCLEASYSRTARDPRGWGSSEDEVNDRSGKYRKRKA
jgi:hypothetical protein